MTVRLANLCAATACLILGGLGVRLVGQFVVGHTFKLSRWLRDRSL